MSLSYQLLEFVVPSFEMTVAESCAVHRLRERERERERYASSQRHACSFSRSQSKYLSGLLVDKSSREMIPIIQTVDH
jgi:hypothetical protein